MVTKVAGTVLVRTTVALPAVPMLWETTLFNLLVLTKALTVATLTVMIKVPCNLVTTMERDNGNLIRQANRTCATFTFPFALNKVVLIPWIFAQAPPTTGSNEHRKMAVTMALDLSFSLSTKTDNSVNEGTARTIPVVLTT